MLMYPNDIVFSPIDRRCIESIMMSYIRIGSRDTVLTYAMLLTMARIQMQKWFC